MNRLGPEAGTTIIRMDYQILQPQNRFFRHQAKRADDVASPHDKIELQPTRFGFSLLQIGPKPGRIIMPIRSGSAGCMQGSFCGPIQITHDRMQPNLDFVMFLRGVIQHANFSLIFESPISQGAFH